MKAEPVTNPCKRPEHTWHGKHLAVFDGEGLVCGACNTPMTMEEGGNEL